VTNPAGIAGRVSLAMLANEVTTYFCHEPGGSGIIVTWIQT